MAGWQNYLKEAINLLLTVMCVCWIVDLDRKCYGSRGKLKQTIGDTAGASEVEASLLFVEAHAFTWEFIWIDIRRERNACARRGTTSVTCLVFMLPLF